MLYFIMVLIAKYTGQWCCAGSTSKDRLPDPRGSLANNVPCRAIEQVSQEVDKTTAIHNTHQTKCQLHSIFCIFKFRVYLISYIRLFTKFNLQNFTLHSLQ